MKKYLLILFLFLFASSNFYPEEGFSSSNLNLPEYSALGKRIADGEAVYVDTFYWITLDGEIKKTDRGWSRVPKSRRHLVYLSKEEALAELYEPEDLTVLDKNSDPLVLGPSYLRRDNQYSNKRCLGRNGAIRLCKDFKGELVPLISSNVTDIHGSIYELGGKNLLSLFPGKGCAGQFNAFTWHKCVGANTWLGKCDSSLKNGLYVGEFLDGRPDGKGYRICATGKNRNTKRF